MERQQRPGLVREGDHGKARDELGSAAEEAGKSPAPSRGKAAAAAPDDRGPVDGGGLERAVGSGDRPAVARQVGRLAAFESELAAWQATGRRAAVSMKKAATLALGILTSVGGFFDVGAIATSAQAGAVFRYQLLWALAARDDPGGLPVEMSGRFAAVTRQALPDAIRQHFGFTFWLVPFAVLTLIHFLVLGAEIGGICFAMHLLTGLPVAFWALPVAALVWLFLWRSTFSAIENSTSLLGLITLAFVVAAWRTTRRWARCWPACSHRSPTTTRRATGSSPSASWAR